MSVKNKNKANKPNCGQSRDKKGKFLSSQAIDDMEYVIKCLFKHVQRLKGRLDLSREVRDGLAKERDALAKELDKCVADKKKLGEENCTLSRMFNDQCKEVDKLRSDCNEEIGKLRLDFNKELSLKNSEIVKRDCKIDFLKFFMTPLAFSIGIICGFLIKYATGK